SARSRPRNPGEVMYAKPWVGCRDGGGDPAQCSRCAREHIVLPACETRPFSRRRRTARRVEEGGTTPFSRLRERVPEESIKAAPLPSPACGRRCPEGG